MQQLLSFWRPLAALLVFTLLFSCGNAPASAAEEVAIEDLGPNASIIRSPVNANTQEADTAHVARMAFENNEHLFGEIDEGGIVQHDFAFTNTGSQPLLISNARSTCGCTVPDYPKEPILPGASGVTITANTYPATSVIYMDGNVIND
jgi:hypothetical protein